MKFIFKNGSGRNIELAQFLQPSGCNWNWKGFVQYIFGLVSISQTEAPRTGPRNNAMSKDRNLVYEFIQIYRSFPCLWLKSDMHYYNAVSRDAAYTVLWDKLKEFNPRATKKCVTSKINSLRSAYNKEVRKVLESKRNGSEVYRPSLWYYDLLSFLHNQEATNESVSIMDWKEEDNTVNCVCINIKDEYKQFIFIILWI